MAGLKGRKASILTKMIRPRRDMSTFVDGHRSDIIIEGSFLNNQGKLQYSFRLAEDENSPLLNASARYVKLHKDAFQEPEIPWSESEAKCLLLKALLDRKIPWEPDPSMPTKDIYMSIPELSLYDYRLFSGRLSSMRATVADAHERKVLDERLFRRFKKDNPVSFKSYKGYPQWQGSDAQAFAKDDLKHNRHVTDGFKKMYNDNIDVNKPWPFAVYCDKLRQEIKTAKHLHTLEVEGKGGGGLLSHDMMQRLKTM